MEDTRSALVRHTAVMSLGTALSRITGVARLIATVAALGIIKDRLADAYNTANVTPNIIYELVLGGVLSSVFVPVFVDWMQTRGPEEARDVARDVMSIAIVVLGTVMVVGMVAAPVIISLYTVQVPAAQQEATRALASFFLVFFMPQILLYGVGSVATGLLNAHRRFAAPMFAPILNNLVVIATMIVVTQLPGPTNPGELATTAQKYILAIGTTFGVFAMTAALWPSLRRTGFRFRWRLQWRDAAVRRIVRLATWVIVYVVSNQLAYLLVIVLANRDTGGLSAYQYAFIVFQLPHAIFVVSVFTALLPAMSSRWSAGDREGYRSQLSMGIRATAFIIIPAALGYLALAQPIARLLFAHGPFAGAAQPEQQTRFVAQILFAFALGLFSFSTFQLLTRGFYAMQDSRTPALVNVGANLVNVAANLLFFFVLHLGVRGLALGHATAYTAGTAALLWAMRRRLDRIEGRRIAAGVGKALVAGGGGAGVAWGVARLVGDALGTTTLPHQVVQIAAAVAAGVLVFGVIALIVGAEEVDTVKNMLVSRFGR